MTRISAIFLIFLLTECSGPASSKETPLSKELGAFLIPGKYEVRVLEGDDNSKLINPIKEQLTLTNSLGKIKFYGSVSFSDLDSISINLNDSTLLRHFSINHFIDTVSFSSDKSGFDEHYFGYAFGEDNSGGIADIPEFRQFFSKENISEQKSLFIIGRTKKKNNSIFIKRMERVVLSGRTLLDVNKTFILTPNYSQQ